MQPWPTSIPSLSAIAAVRSYLFMSSSSAGCAVRATLGFRYDYLNAWDLY